MKLYAGKCLLLLLATATLIDSLSAPKGASPGHAGAFFLAWVFSTRFFLPKPSFKLALFSVFLTATCTASNHRIVTIAILGSPYYYFACGLLVVSWERIAGFFETGRSVNHD